MIIMPGLVPGIFFAVPKRMAGTSPAMMGVWGLDEAAAIYSAAFSPAPPSQPSKSAMARAV